MTTVIEKKTPVEAKWTQAQIQKTITHVMAGQMLATFEVLGKHAPQAIPELQSKMREGKVAHYKQLGVKTPIDLARAIAEYDVNVFGSKISIEGNDQKAIVTYEQCAFWCAMKESGKIPPQKEQEMGKQFESCMSDLAKEFGFKAEIKFEGEIAVLTISK